MYPWMKEMDSYVEFPNILVVYQEIFGLTWDKNTISLLRVKKIS